MSGDQNFEKVANVSKSLTYGLHDIANDIRELIRSDAWRSFVDPTGRVNTYRSFAEFVETPPVRGLGSDLRTLKRVVADEKDVIDLIDQATQNPRGRPPKNMSNGHNNYGTDGIGRALRRLRKDRPDLHAKVLADEITVHGAMVEAGFRPKTVTIRLDDPEKLAQALSRKLDPDDIRSVAKFLLEVVGE